MRYWVLDISCHFLLILFGRKILCIEKRNFSQGLPWKFYQIHINKFENSPTERQWSVQSSVFGEALNNDIYVNDVNELRIAIEAIKNKHKV